jgi:hypothetical protein
MEVVCTTNAPGLTEGKVYAVLDDRGNKWNIRNDKGVRSSYFKTRFMLARNLNRVTATEVIDSWDEATRGPRMANPTGRAIFKYPIPALEQFDLFLPIDAQIIRIDHIDGFTWLWAVVDLRADKERRRFRAFKTGATIRDDFDTSHYLGFYPINVQQELGLYVFEEK